MKDQYKIEPKVSDEYLLTKEDFKCLISIRLGGDRYDVVPTNNGYWLCHSPNIDDYYQPLGITTPHGYKITRIL